MKGSWWILGCILTMSCTLDQKPLSEPKVYVTISSEWGTAVKVQIFTEGPDGNALTGSLISVQNPGNEVELLKFDYSKGCYNGSFESFLSGFYTIEMKGRLFPNETYTLTVPHNPLSEKATIRTMGDSTGKSVMSGEVLDRNQSISLTWDTVLGATIYQVQIGKDSIPIWTGSSVEGSLILPSGTLPSEGNYSIMITAQYLSGDILFRSENYSSQSLSRGTSFYFLVK